MNTNLTNRSICVAVLFGWATCASALSLGELSGAAVMGRPLELVAPIRLDEISQGNGSGCVTAQVRYGDTLMDSARVRVELKADAAGQVSYARITSPSLVDEPFVTVLLQAGCVRQSSRRYVLLAEAPGAQPVALVAAPALPGRGPTASTRVTEAPVPRPPAVWPVRNADASAKAQAPAKRPAPALAREAAPRTGGRLQLALWDPNSGQLPWLRASAELKSSPTADVARRAAATSLWRALNAQPQDLLRTAERLRGLESEMGSLRSLSGRHRAEISAARESLHAAQTQRHTALVLVTLLGLLAGGTAAFLWHRSRRSTTATPAGSWYGPPDPLAGPDVAAWQESEPLPPAVIAPVAEPLRVAEAPPLELARAVPPIERPAAVPSPAPAPFTQHDFATGAPLAHLGQRSSLSVDALHGAQQQCEFFASLGQIEEAVAALTSYLEEASEQPVLAYLELLRIYHGTGMRMEYEELQSTFRQTFGMDVANFSEYREDHRELELYVLPVTRIASAWPSVRSQEIIEELLFKRPATPRDLLSLEAYRELLWLYALGQELVHHNGKPAGLRLRGDRGLSNDHLLLPWADGAEQGPAELSLDQLARIDVAPELNGFAVDIDLTAIRAEGHPAGAAVRMPQHGPAAEPAPPPAPPPAAPADAALQAFDAAVASESRRPTR